MAKQFSFSIVGGAGFRAQFYLRIAKALPERFHISGMVVRNEKKGLEIEQKWNVITYRSVEKLLQHENPDFVVVSVSKTAATEVLIQLGEIGIPTLAETPPAPSLEELLFLHEKLSKTKARIQSAEQYHFQPLHAARLEIIRSGKLGRVNQATISISHFYHGISLMRKMLGIGFEEATIKAMRFESPILSGPNRNGPPQEEKMEMSQRDMAWVQFDGKLGVYDFTKNQHRSWIRSNHLSVRGERGEIFDRHVNTMIDYKTPLHLDLKRVNKGEEENLEGNYLEGILAGETWVYRNPFAPARLYDDEIAIATALEKMGEYARGGAYFYSIAEASQDHYLGLMIEKAIKTGEAVKAVRQHWWEGR
ncbi:Gfo/Idh/MocA family oxidoreductase [Evansella sp. AB-P1]|uniref:Gfo/Idh/MocA family protein n=1 Tax=Evansella sp. AB-P1 TaxID=3037653 RepID=UPI00241C1C19|nr:Gfo/Idh/MocA family oxidoreductase [Evansella sp. AB-P1]MDG5786180.1 Gfo/Idh/MocA family oxidoreductase [Evansella sp. AB-P1]